MFVPGSRCPFHLPRLHFPSPTADSASALAQSATSLPVDVLRRTRSIEKPNGLGANLTRHDAARSGARGLRDGLSALAELVKDRIIDQRSSSDHRVPRRANRKARWTCNARDLRPNRHHSTATIATVACALPKRSLASRSTIHRPRSRARRLPLRTPLRCTGPTTAKMKQISPTIPSIAKTRQPRPSSMTARRP